MRMGCGFAQAHGRTCGAAEIFRNRVTQRFSPYCEATFVVAVQAIVGRFNLFAGRWLYLATIGREDCGYGRSRA